jgi:RNA polymerase sigma factor (sigma-70 family)
MFASCQVRCGRDIAQMHTTPPSLLEQLHKPDQPEAWDRFVAPYPPMLFSFARRQGFQDADAHDLTQDILLKLSDLLPTYERRNGEKFSSWLRAVGHNQCVDFRRRRATRQQPGLDGLAEKPDSDSPIQDLEEREFREHLVPRAFQLIRPHLDEITWTAFTRIYLEGRPAAEVAAEQGTRTSSVTAKASPVASASGGAIPVASAPGGRARWRQRREG